MTDNIHRFLFRLSRLFHGLRAPGVGDALQLVRGARSVSASPPALTCLAYIKESQSLLIMSSVSPDKRRKMESALEQLKKHTVVVADTGDFNGSRCLHFLSTLTLA